MVGETGERRGLENRKKARVARMVSRRKRLALLTTISLARSLVPQTEQLGAGWKSRQGLDHSKIYGPKKAFDETYTPGKAVGRL